MVNLHRSRVSAFALLSFFACTNFSTEEITVNTPVILRITSLPAGGHRIYVAAQNAEIGFTGYRIFAGASEDAVQSADPQSGIDCTQPLTRIPSQGVEYYMDVQAGIGVPADEDGAICNFPITLPAGNYAAIRAVRIKSVTSLTTGSSSNAVIVP